VVDCRRCLFQFLQARSHLKPAVRCGRYESRQWAGSSRLNFQWQWQIRADGGHSLRSVRMSAKAIGGGGSAPSPGWLARAALATCDATRIALRAAELGHSLETLEVTADSVDDDRGLFGMDATVRAGSLSMRTRVKIGAKGVDDTTLRQIVDYAIAHSPVADGCRAATPSTVEITIT
jgi:uncharacterized OsmC-like protein